MRDYKSPKKTVGGNDHLPFERKKQLVDAMKDTHTITVCDFEPEYIDYWKKQFNPNKNDCCNLRKEF